ncbi:MAG: hypothetical protein ACLFQX_11590 [Candidatus Kapaibacterium sp.]
MSRNKLKRLPEYTFLGCPLTKNRTPWCFRICSPDADKCGPCGRPAPHAFRSHIQLGIDEYKRRKSAESAAQSCPE